MVTVLSETEKRAAPGSVTLASVLSAAAAAEGERRNNGKGTCPLESFESSMWADATFDSEQCSTKDGATVRSAASTSVFSAGTRTSAYHDGNIWERIESKRSKAQQQQESAPRREQEIDDRDETAIRTQRLLHAGELAGAK